MHQKLPVPGSLVVPVERLRIPESQISCVTASDIQSQSFLESDPKQTKVIFRNRGDKESLIQEQADL